MIIQSHQKLHMAGLEERADDSEDLGQAVDDDRAGTFPVVSRSLIFVMAIVLVVISLISGFLLFTSLQTTEAQLTLKASQFWREETLAHLGATSETVENNYAEVLLSMQASSNELSKAKSPEELEGLMRITFYAVHSHMVDSISYVNRDGILQARYSDDSFITTPIDFSDREYFKATISANKPYISSLYSSLENRTSVALAVPVPPLNGDVSQAIGVLAAQIPVERLDETFLEHYPPSYHEQYFLVDTLGTIVSTSNKDHVGINVANFMLTAGDAEDESTRNNNLDLMYQGYSGNFVITNPAGQEFLVAYEPIIFQDNFVGTSLLMRPVSTITDFASSLQNQRIYTLIAVILIATAAAIYIIFVVVINRLLHRTVKVQDVQIRKQLSNLQSAYKKLKEQDIIKDEFINIASHELRTPILPIILNAESLADEFTQPNQKVEVILRNAKRINKLTNDILDVSRVESNTFKLERSATDITKLLHEAIEDVSFKLSAQTKGNVKILFESNLSRNRIVSIDKGRITQVVNNLLNNAINFTEEGSITISLSNVSSIGGAETMQITIADTGKGIDPSIKDKLFQKFITKSHRAEGTGLGLYLCKAIIEAHGGTIKAENNPTGKGAIFSFTLPISAI